MLWKKPIWACIGFAVLVFASGRPAYALEAGISIQVHQDVQCSPTAQNCPNDYHVEGLICSKNGPPMLVDHVDDLFSPPNGNFAFWFGPAGLPDPCWYKFTADWWLNPPQSIPGIPYCTILHLGLLFDVDAANVVIDMHGWWTRDGRRIGELLPLGNGGFVPVLGFDVWDDPGFGQALSIANGNIKQPPVPVPPIPVEIIQLEVVSFPAATPPNFRDLREGGAQQFYPWVKVVHGSGAPIDPANPLSLMPDSFFDVWLQATMPGQAHPVAAVVIPPGGFLVARQKIAFTNNAGAREERWEWEIHGAQAAEACCFPDGSCQDLPPFDCMKNGGTPQGATTTCATTVCELPKEACCLPDGSCQELLPADCRGLGGIPQGAGTTCATTVCAPSGACCYDAAAPMCLVTDQIMCEQQLMGTWKGPGTDCTDADGDGVADVCEPQEQPEACCLPDGQCGMLPAKDCLGQGGEPKGPGSRCLGDMDGDGRDDLCAAKWTQLPDLATTGVDVYASEPLILADDWLCKQQSLVTQIRIFGSWLYDQAPGQGGEVEFTLSIHKDIPAGPDAYSRPGEPLWVKHFPPGSFIFRPYQGQIEEGWWDPRSTGSYIFPGDHVCWEYVFNIPQGEAFCQLGSAEKPVVYWLDVQAKPMASTQAQFGWKTSTNHWNDDAVWGQGGEPFTGPWFEMRYPPQHPWYGQSLDLAFTIGGDQPCTKPMDFGDAPEGVVAYPTGVVGSFPTCMTVGPANWIQHTNFGAWFGPAVDFELDGNAGLCPGFAPYDADECMNDGDAGLITPGAFTMVGTKPASCPQSSPVPLGFTCATATWGANIDIQLQNMMPSQSTAYVNVLVDWDQDGKWSGASSCLVAMAPEHVLVDFPIPPGFVGPLSALMPPGFLIGPKPGFVWTRFSLTEKPVASANWDGSGSFEDGETEDYLLLVQETQWDFGDAPDPTYPTLLANNGARHRVGSGLMLGSTIDPENDGQPNAVATGDDLANLDDEDGVTFNTALFPGVPNTITLVVSDPGGGGARLDAWIDFDGNGSWAEAGEQIFTSLPVSNGTNSLTFTPGAIAATGKTFARFRLSYQGGLSFTGPALDGEVEDYKIDIAPVKWLQRPDTDWTGVDVDMVDTELADDFRCTMSGPITDLHVWTSFRYDEFPMPLNSLTFQLTLYTDVPVGPNNKYSHPGGRVWSRVYGPGTYNAGLVARVPNGEWWHNPTLDFWTFPGDWSIFQFDFYVDPTQAFVQREGRIYWLGVKCLGPMQMPVGWKSSLQHWNDDAVWLDSRGSVPVWRELRYGDGHPMAPESMDLAFALTGQRGTPPDEDFGDAPDPTYPTLLPNGTSHLIVPGMFLGNRIDGEANGQPTPMANGDDLANLPDEDGVVFLTPLARGRTCTIQVIASAPGMLDAWLDFQRNGSWAEAVDQIFASRPLAAGVNLLSFVVPTNASLGQTFARFRYSSAGGLSYSGLAQDGEVEDYQVKIVPAEIMGRYIFYNNSYYDGSKLAIDPAPLPGPFNDDADAIDPNKAPLFSGTATFANWTGYAQGINGLIYDVKYPSRTPVVGDFTFSDIGRAGTTLPGTIVVPAYATYTYVSGGETITRCVMTFPSVGGGTPSGTVQNTWLKVDIGTGFGAPAETHYWGNARGDCGTVTATYIFVNSTDEIGARNNLWISVPRAPITHIWDYNKDGFCNSTDQVFVRNNLNISTTTAVRVITK